MEFTGTNLTLTRNIYTQTGQYGFNFACTVDNTTGQYLFGISGAQGVVEFKLESGKMYHQNKLIHSYKPYQEFVVEAQFTSGSVNVVKDGAPLLYGYPKATGNFDTFYVKRANAGMGAEFDLSFSGNNIPTYSISTLGYILSSGQEGVTGYFVNQSAFPLRVFDSSFQSDDGYTFGKLQSTIGAAGTGRFSFSGDFNEIDLTDPILTTFNTSYGDTSILFTIVNASTLNRFIYLTGPTNFTFDNTGILNRDLTYLNYSGSAVTNAFGASLSFQLSYISGEITGAGPSGDGVYATGYLDFTSFVGGDTVSIYNPATSQTFSISPGGPGVEAVCDGIGGYFMLSTLSLTGVPSCLSGFTGAGVRAMFNAPYNMYFTALDVGTGSNSIVMTTSWAAPGSGNLIGGSGSGIPGGGGITGKTFTGSWDFKTGLLSTSLVSMKRPGNFNSNMISGVGTFAPNSLVNFQVTHIITDANNDGARLVISGAEVLNPIAQNLSN